LLAVAAGGVIWLMRDPRSRALAVGVLLGVPAVYLLTGLAPPPWWAMVWFLPIAAMLLATPGAALLARLRVPHASAAIGAGAAAGAAALTLVSGYPAGWPHWIGYRDAPAVAEHLGSREDDGSLVATRAQWYRSIIYELAVRGISRTVTEHSDIDPAPGQRLIHIRGGEGAARPALDALDPKLAARLRLIRSMPLGGSIIDEYLVREPAP
jgi:hypothetical protein